MLWLGHCHRPYVHCWQSTDSKAIITTHPCHWHCTIKFISASLTGGMKAGEKSSAPETRHVYLWLLLRQDEGSCVSGGGPCFSPGLTQWGSLLTGRGLCSQQMTNIHYSLFFWLPLFVLPHIFTLQNTFAQHNVTIPHTTYNVFLPSAMGGSPKWLKLQIQKLWVMCLFSLVLYNPTSEFCHQWQDYIINYSQQTSSRKRSFIKMCR